MFRTKEEAREPFPPQKEPVEEKSKSKGEIPVTLIGQGSQVKGELKSPGSVTIDGYIEGTVNADNDVRIGPHGDVGAEIEARNVTVAGKVKGRIFADGKVVLLTGSHVEGDIHAQSLKIEDSVFFQGGCVMGEGGRKRRATENTPLPKTIKEAA
jgi:cytoskeletal protein CcmA (bactofilin family)